MSKYFSNDSDFSNYQDTTIILDNNTNKNTIINDIIEPLTPEKKEILNNISSKDTPISSNDQVNKMVNDYTHATNTEVKNQFNSMTSVELFEKMNQLIFVVSNLSNKIADLEIIIKNNKLKNMKEPMEISDPKDLIDLERKLNTFNKPASINDVQSQLNNIKKGNIDIPLEDYIDNSVRLEEMFPNLDDEAYQAGYNALSQTKPKPQTSKNIDIGTMRGGSNGF